jgi:predicted cobalt transporter CbtA
MLPAATVRALTIPALVREQTRWIATIVFSAIGLMIAF